MEKNKYFYYTFISICCLSASCRNNGMLCKIYKMKCLLEVTVEMNINIHNMNIIVWFKILIFYKYIKQNFEIVRHLQKMRNNSF